MRGIFAQFLLITVTLQHSGFKELRNSLLTLILEETTGIDDNDQLLSRRDLWVKVSEVVMNSSFDEQAKENTVREIVEDKEKSVQMIQRLEDIQEKSRVYGISGTDVLMAALLTGFTPKFQVASTENRMKMIEKIIINAAPTNEEKEARNLEDMLVDASMTPNYIAEMNERQSARIDFLFEVVRIASDSKKSQDQKITAIIAQIDRSRFYTKIVEVIQNFNVVDFAERLIFEFSWIKLDVKKEEYSKMSREEKMNAVIQAIQANIKSL